MKLSIIKCGDGLLKTTVTDDMGHEHSIRAMDENDLTTGVNWVLECSDMYPEYVWADDDSPQQTRP